MMLQNKTKEDITRTIEFMCSEYGWTLKYILSMPIPQFKIIVGNLQKRKELEAKSYKKKR